MEYISAIIGAIRSGLRTQICAIHMDQAITVDTCRQTNSFVLSTPDLDLYQIRKSFEPDLAFDESTSNQLLSFFESKRQRRCFVFC